MDITEDYQYLIVTRSNDKKIEVYKYDGNNYQHLSTLSHSVTTATLNEAQISGDGKFIVFGDSNKQIYLYEN